MYLYIVIYTGKAGSSFMVSAGSSRTPSKNASMPTSRCVSNVNASASDNGCSRSMISAASASPRGGVAWSQTCVHLVLAFFLVY